ncbi:Adhesion G-protein coupled receptor G4 [Liparis tanakae]|uniref:Adhesion G-protein coupled receptor G4 n=1 Tax=Liparis tanakae TaxID=230148 RepID=A0A4Z2I4K3_9TELE|nr:Adhesion G-protein coupled receptor G4 [Liparis tanakae]
MLQLRGSLFDIGIESLLFAAMDSVRSLSCVSLICLCTQLLGSSGVAASSANTSLWGKKLSFWGRPCIWQLQPEVVVPALQELSVCMLLHHTHALEWTGFDYKAPGKAHIELGLGGTGTHLSVWLFGEMHSVKRDLKLLDWYNVCVTWSGRAHRLRIYINGTSEYETSVKAFLPQQLASHGTLTLGVSHYTINNGEVQPQTGKDLLGEIGRFRMWAREWSAEELKGQSCAEGDVLSCEVYVSVDPAADVDVVQAHIASLLSSTFSSHLLTMTADPHSISVVPVAPTQSLPARPANMSTTGDPLDLNKTAVGPDTFFRVKLTLGMYGSQTKSEEIIEKWVKQQLDNGTMTVLNLIIERIVRRNMGQHNGLMVSNGAEVVDMIQDLVGVQLGNNAELSSSELSTVVEKLCEVIDIGSIKPAVGANIVNIVADILLSKTYITPVAGIINNSHISNLKDGVLVTFSHQTPKQVSMNSVHRKLRRDYPSKILINLSAALLGLSMLFLLNSWLSSFSDYSLCIATAATMHYFLLASFTWMGLEAVHMYLALVKVFNIYVPSYILKFCAVGWGVPLVVVSLVLAIDKDAYGSSLPDESAVMLQSSDQLVNDMTAVPRSPSSCWLQNDVFFYVTVVAFVLLILLCNTVVFTVVLIQIRKMRANKHSTNRLTSLHDLRAVAGLTVLLGLTWSIGFFSFGAGKVVFMYLFSIFNTLQDWSRSMTAGGRCNNNRFVNSDSVASDNTSTIRKISDSSTLGSTPNHQQGA